MSTSVMNRKTNKACVATGVRAVLYSGMVALALACSSTDRRVDDIVVYPTPTENPADEIQRLKAEIDSARGKNVDVLSPTWFAGAEKSLAAAQKIQQQGGDYRQLFRRSVEGRVQIQRANEISKTSEKIVQDVLKARDEAVASRQQALKSGATDMETISDAMKSADKKLVRITAAVENNNLDNMVDRRSDAIAAYREVQSHALRKGKLDTAKRVIQEAERQNAKKFAPKSLSYAKEVVSSAEQLIETNPRAAEDIERRSDEALFYARRALLVAQESRDVSRRNPEDTVLYFEQGLSSIAEQAGAEDMRDEKFDAQIDALKGHVAGTNRQPVSPSLNAQRNNPVAVERSSIPNAKMMANELNAKQRQQASLRAPGPIEEETRRVETTETTPPQQAAQSSEPVTDSVQDPIQSAAGAIQAPVARVQPRQEPKVAAQAPKRKLGEKTAQARGTGAQQARGTTIINQRDGDKVTVTVEPGRRGEPNRDRQSTLPREDKM
jgi:hypothetical protein